MKELIFGVLTLLWTQGVWADPIQRVHGDTCWLSSSGGSIRVASFNDRTAELWDEAGLKASVEAVLHRAGVKPSGAVQVHLACSDLGHQILIAGAAGGQSSYCLATDMKFSGFELYASSAGTCDPYVAGEILIYEPDEAARGEILSRLTRKEHGRDIAAVTAEGAVILVRLRKAHHFNEPAYLKRLEKVLPQGSAAFLNSVAGFPSEQAALLTFTPAP